jgi:UTP--glucose-1-phosphate uridylyltransferase
MLPLVDKPIIQYGVEEALAAGCDQIIIITGRGKSAIEDHFDVSYELEKMLEEKGKTDLLNIVRQISDMIHVAYVRQKEALGLGHAVLTARELIGDEPFATPLADDVIDSKVPCLRQLMNVFDEKQCSVIATQVVEGPAISSYGVLKAKEVPARAESSTKFSTSWKNRSARISESRGDRSRILTPTVFETLSTSRRVRAASCNSRTACAPCWGEKDVRVRDEGRRRHRRQAWIPEGNRRVRTQTRRSGCALS